MFKIRSVSVGDVDDLYELYTRHLTTDEPSEPQDLNQWRLMIERITSDEKYCLLVGEAGGKVVASVTLVVVENLTHHLRPYAIIENVVTHRDHRNNGYASALMQKAIDIAKDHDCYKATLTTGSKRESTLRFYERCGFNMHDKTAFIKHL